MEEDLQRAPTSEFSHGTIVALKSHPYEKDIYSTIIAGDGFSLSPLMIVIEEILESRTAYNEKTGEEISKNGSSQCKCLWFSTKKQEFIEGWFASKFLKVIKKLDKQRDAGQIQPSRNKDLNQYSGKMVLFRTSKLEYNKKKSSISFKNNSSESTPTIAPILSFVSPVMQIIQVMEARNSEIKEPFYDPKTGKKKKFASEWVAKCRWYNSDSEKTSEKIIPIDCLEEIYPTNESYLSELQTAISAGRFLHNDAFLIKPLRLIHANGEYSLRGFNYIKNKVVDLDIKRVNNLQSIDNYFSDYAPMYNPETAEIMTIKDAIKKAELDSHFLRIKYEKNKDNFSTRTLSKFRLLEAPNADGVPTSYLIGHCHLRGENRTFVVDKISDLHILNLKF